ANSLTFRNPSGYAASYPNATLADWRLHLSWMSKQGGLSAHWPALLVVVDENTKLPPAWSRELEPLPHERFPLSKIQVAIKGLEYQHVVLVLSRDRLNAIERGFTGSGRPLYNEFRLLRIPFTRAKDSIGVFGAG